MAIMVRGVARAGTRTNVKDGAEVVAALIGGDTVYGELSSQEEDVFFYRIYRNGEIFWDFGKKVKAVTMNLDVTRNVLEPNPLPDPEPEPPTADVTRTHIVEVFSDGSIIVDGVIFT